MWQYEKIPVNKADALITKRYIQNLMCEDDKIPVTKEGVRYIRDLVRPWMEKLDECITVEAMEELEHTIPYTDKVDLKRWIGKKWERLFDGIEEHISEYDDEWVKQCLEEEKTRVVKVIVTLLTVDEQAGESGVTRSGGIVDPWVVYEYIVEHDTLKQFFQPELPKVDIGLPMGITLGITRNQLVGMMAVYRYLRKPSVFTMYGFPLKSIIEDVNEQALQPRVRTDNGWYNIEVGDTVFSFDNLDFLQGCMAGCQWIGVDPHSVLKDLKQYKGKKVMDEGRWIKRETYVEDLTF